MAKGRETSRTATAVAVRVAEAGVRAKAEAEARHSLAGPPAASPEEVGGPKGLEPTRYGDWERKGIASDF
ncbi:MAG TPA: DUF1674 domain-containing protein [Rhizomicrobium sp.]|jgi:hypothetical protein